jgi:polysaccharide deacetylase family protein (PEP-CTERM system associated)
VALADRVALERHDQLSPVQNGRTTGRIAAPTAMSIDVEDWFHVENLRDVVSRESWNRRELRVERTMDRMLELMAEHDVKATCFVLGWVAERAPGLVRRLAAAGHEVASHGYHHELVHELTEEEFAADVRRSKDVLEGITGERVRGYRAPSFSLTDRAIPLLEEAGFEYDSSFFPTTVTRNRYGKPATLEGSDGLRLGNGGLAEVPLPCLQIGGQALPWAGGGYFRLVPYRLFKSGVEKILDSGKPYIFYIHPWELDSGQPRVAGLGRSQRIRHYLNLERTESRWTALLTDFRWTTIADLLRVEGAKRHAQEILGES